MRMKPLFLVKYLNAGMQEGVQRDKTKARVLVAKLQNMDSDRHQPFACFALVLRLFWFLFWFH